MTMKICYATIQDGMLKLPEEVLEVLPQGIRLYMRTDSEKGTVIICAKDPADRPEENKWCAAEMAAMVADENWEEYYQPVPEELWPRPPKREAE